MRGDAGRRWGTSHCTWPAGGEPGARPPIVWPDHAIRARRPPHPGSRAGLAGTSGRTVFGAARAGDRETRSPSRPGPARKGVSDSLRTTCAVTRVTLSVTSRTVSAAAPDTLAPAYVALGRNATIPVDRSGTVSGRRCEFHLGGHRSLTVAAAVVAVTAAAVTAAAVSVVTEGRLW